MATRLLLRGDDAAAGQHIGIETQQLAECTGWFGRVFGSSMKLPAPITEASDTHEPVFAVPIPHAVLRELVHAIRFPALRVDLHRHVPPALREHMTGATWRTYVEYYLPAPQAQNGGEPAAKKAKTVLTAADFTSVRHVYLRRVAGALAAEINANHPQFTDLLSGAAKAIWCDFINTFRLSAVDRTYLLSVPGEPVVEPVNIAFTIGMELAYSNSGYWLTHRDNADTVCKQYFIMCLHEALGAAYTVTYTMAITRKTGSKKPFQAKYWPAEAGQLQPRDYDVMRLAIEARPHGVIMMSANGESSSDD